MVYNIICTHPLNYLNTITTTSFCLGSLGYQRGLITVLNRKMTVKGNPKKKKKHQNDITSSILTPPLSPIAQRNNKNVVAQANQVTNIFTMMEQYTIKKIRSNFNCLLCQRINFKRTAEH